MTLLNAQAKRVSEKIENDTGKRVAVVHALQFQHFLTSTQNTVLAGVHYLPVPVINLTSFLASALTPVYCLGLTEDRQTARQYAYLHM
jgi:hypothetical protein